MFSSGDNKRVIVKTKCVNSRRACGVPLMGREGRVKLQLSSGAVPRAGRHGAWTS